MNVGHPRREDYPSEHAHLNACLAALDAAFPAREQYRERIAAWRRMEAPSDLDAVVARLRELVEIDREREMTDAECREFVALSARRVELRRGRVREMGR